MANDTYTQLGLRSFPRPLARAAKKAAAQRDMTLSSFVALAVTQTLKHPRQSSSIEPDLERDIVWYERERSELEKRYAAGMSLAIIGERVVDHDSDSAKLARRLRAKYGRRSILMPRIGKRPVRHVRSPHRMG